MEGRDDREKDILYRELCRKRHSSLREQEYFRNGKWMSRVGRQIVTRREVEYKAGGNELSHIMMGLKFCAKEMVFQYIGM